ncbi:MAG: hypothetical protein ACPH8C_04510, partial [Candidatus Puniceispirillaceae bacterium]
GDGLPDLIVQSLNFRKSSYESFRTAFPYIFINRNYEYYAPVKLANMAPLLPLSEMVAGDFNGDGRYDLAALKGIRIMVFLADKPFDPSMLGSRDPQQKYDRTRAGLAARFACLVKALSDSGDTGFPTEAEIAGLIDGLEGNNHYRTKRHLVKLGLPKDAVKKHKANLLKLVNFEGSNEEYCAKPLR